MFKAEFPSPFQGEWRDIKRSLLVGSASCSNKAPHPSILGSWSASRASQRLHTKKQPARISGCMCSEVLAEFRAVLPERPLYPAFAPDNFADVYSAATLALHYAQEAASRDPDSATARRDLAFAEAAVLRWPQVIAGQLCPIGNASCRFCRVVWRGGGMETGGLVANFNWSLSVKTFFHTCGVSLQEFGPSDACGTVV